jgi:hypothetical protein
MAEIVNLDYIFAKIGAAAKRRSEILSHIIALYQNGLKSFVRNGVGGRGHKCDCKIEKPVADEFIRLFKTRRATFDKNLTTEGIVYCFICRSQLMHNKKLLTYVKIGQTINWKKRSKKYGGPTAIAKLIGLRQSKDRVAGENRIIETFEKEFHKIKREWFLLDDDQLKTLESTFVNINIP